MKIEILLADDQLLILEGIKAILEPEPKIKVVGTAQDGKTAIALVKELRPDILLIDIEMPEMNGISATKYICKYLPNTKVIVLTSHKNQDYIAEALLAGASGYLWKGNLIEDLKQEIYSFGKGYSSVKAKLLTNGQSHAPKGTSSNRLIQTAQKNCATNAVEYREKIIYFKKYRKSIYKPAVSQKKQQQCFYPKGAKRARLKEIKQFKSPAYRERARCKGVSQRPKGYRDPLVFASFKTQSLNPGIAKADRDRIFKAFTTKGIGTTNPKTYSSSSVCSRSRFNRRKYRRIIIWLSLVIFSIVLSIVIF